MFYFLIHLDNIKKINSIINMMVMKFFLKYLHISFFRSSVKPETETFLNELNAIQPPNSSAVVWEAKNLSRNLEEYFDAVIITIPVPQFLG